MKLSEKNLQYGCHSAIQKAIRRRDLDLTKTAFDVLWNDAKHRSWLKWRLTVLVQEEAWYYLGALSEFLAKKTDDEREWRKFIYTLTIIPKMKDAGALSVTAVTLPPQEDDHEELKIVREYIEKAKGDPASVVDEVFEDCAKTCSEYEKNALRILRVRATKGGMLCDRYCSLAAMVLIAKRGLVKEEIDSYVKEALSVWTTNFNRQPQMAELPWFVFDMHTAIGQLAFDVFMKRRASHYPGMTKELFDNIWFFMESGFTPNVAISYADVKEPTPFQTIHWVPLVRRSIPYGEMSAKEVSIQWREKLKWDVKALVEWALEKRGEQ